MSDVAVEISMFERIGGASPSTVWSRASIGGYVLPDARGSEPCTPQSRADQECSQTLSLRMDGGAEALFRRKGPSAAAAAAYGFKIGELERDACCWCMKGALEESVAEVEARQEIYGCSRSSPIGCATRPAILTIRARSVRDDIAMGDLAGRILGQQEGLPVRGEAIEVSHVVSAHDTAGRLIDENGRGKQYPDLLSAAPHSQNPSSGRPHGCDPGQTML